MKRRARRLAAAVVAAGVVHAVAGRHLAAVDPIAALRGHHAATVVVAAIGLGAARLFLYVIAPAWAAHLTGRCVAQAIARARREQRRPNLARRSTSAAVVGGASGRSAEQRADRA